MATYLLTWNPKKSHRWGDNLEDDFQRHGDVYFGNWSSGKSKNIVSGDRVFLIRLGKDPRGIVASGWADSNVYQRSHWDAALADRAKTGLFVDVRLDTLLDAGNEDIFPRETLDKGILGKMHWDSQASGVHIPNDVAATLENEWADFLGSERKPLLVAQASALEGLRTESVRYVRGRSRQLRDRVLKDSDGTCCVCDVDYQKILNGKGARVLQVHHRKQLAATDAPRITNQSDLAVVCANCHMLIHMDPQRALSIEGLRRMLGRGVDN